MSTPPKPIVDVRARRGTSGRPTLVVEGKDDVDVYTRWLKKLLGPGGVVASRVDVIPVNSKFNVLAVLRWFRDRDGDPSDLFGIVDRDEWDAEMIAALKAELRQLRVNPARHSLESYFCDPSEIAPALLAEDSASFGPRLSSLEAQLNAALTDRVDHWSLFTLTERVKNRLNDADYPGFFHEQYRLPPDPDIQLKLRNWSQIVDEASCMAEFVRLRTDGRANPPASQCRAFVWAKPFFEQIVCGGASGLQSIKAKATNTWMTDLAEFAPVVPPDIEPILRELIP